MVISSEIAQRDRQAFGAELKKAIGDNKVKDDDIVLVTYTYGGGAAPARKPDFVVLPETKEDVIAVIRLAGGRRVPVTVTSAGAGGYTLPPQGGIVMDMRRMDRILEIDTASGRAAVEPGCSFDRLNAVLRARGMHLGPGSAPDRPLSSLYYLQPDAIIDLEVVMADGTDFHTGQTRFMGASPDPRADLAGLFARGHGAIAIVTRAELSVFHLKEASRAAITAFDSFASAVDFVLEANGSDIPGQCFIWNGHFYEAVAPGPAETNAAYPAPGNVPRCMAVFLSGGGPVATAAEKLLGKLARKHAGRMLGQKDIRRHIPLPVWQEQYTIYDAELGAAPGLYLARAVLAGPEKLKSVESHVMSGLADAGIAPVRYSARPLDQGRDMIFRVSVPIDPADTETAGRVETGFNQTLDTAIERFGASPLADEGQLISVERKGVLYEALKRIKKALDPDDILNAGAGVFPGGE